MREPDIAFIGLEWGLASFRAHGFDRSARRLRTATEPFPLDLARPDQARAEVAASLNTLCGGDVPVIVCGMGAGVFEPEGSWDRIACPISLDDLAGGMKTARLGTRPVHVSPGLTTVSPFGSYDVLRGEEVPALALATSGETVTFLSVPGRHGKWMALRSGRIERFHTAMTAELHHLLATHSIVGKGWGDGGRITATFLEGVDQGLQKPALARAAFELRGAVLSGSLTAWEAGDRAWGLLIGTELAEALPAVGLPDIVVAGRQGVADLYVAALAHMGRLARLEDGDRLAAAGLAELGHRLGLVERRDQMESV